MEFVKIIPLGLLSLCVVILESVASDRWTCDERQYAEFGRSVTVSCIFPSDYKGVYWYDSADSFAELVIRREKLDDGNFTTGGPGYSNGTYEIEPDGSLVITNVSNIHDRVFSVSLIEDDRTINNFDVEVVTIYHGDQHHPHLSLCPMSNLCLVTSKEAEELNCTYNNMRPAVTLSWNFSAPQTVSDVKTTNTLDGKFTFSSHSSVKVLNGTLKPLLTITCAANGAALNFQPVTSTAVVDITQNSTEEIWTETDQVCAETNTRVEVECAREQSEATSLLWKRGGISSSLILMFLSNGQMKQVNSMNSTIMFSDKGTLTLTNVSIHQEGLYTCVYTDGEEYYSHSLKIIVTESCDNKDTYNVIPIAAVGTGITVFLIVVAVVLFVMCRKKKSAKSSSTSLLKELIDTLTYWPLNTLCNTPLFDKEVISLFRTVSNEIEKDRKEENETVISASSAGITGGVMAMAAPFVPLLSIPMLIGGAVIGATGAGMNIAASWDKLRKDKENSKLVQKTLKNFIEIQKQMAETTILLDFAYGAIGKPYFDTCLNKMHVNQIKSVMNRVKTKQNLSRSTLMEQLSHLHSCMVDLRTIMTKDLSYETASLVDLSYRINNLNIAMLPFDYLPTSIKRLAYNEENDTQATFLTFMKLLYRPNQTVLHHGNRDGVRCTRDAERNMQTELVQSGLLVCRTAAYAADVGDDIVKIGNSVSRIARGVSVAGVLLSTLGIVVDVDFLGSAIMDMEKTEKGQFSRALSEAADTMETMNRIIEELSQLD